MGRRRGQPYGVDLRDRVLAAVGEPIRAVAARFAVSPSYVSKVRARLRETGQARRGRSAITFARVSSRSTTCCERESRKRRTRRLPSCAPGWLRSLVWQSAIR